MSAPVAHITNFQFRSSNLESRYIKVLTI